MPNPIVPRARRARTRGLAVGVGQVNDGVQERAIGRCPMPARSPRRAGRTTPLRPRRRRPAGVVRAAGRPRVRRRASRSGTTRRSGSSRAPRWRRRSTSAGSGSPPRTASPPGSCTTGRWRVPEVRIFQAAVQYDARRRHHGLVARRRPRRPRPQPPRAGGVAALPRLPRRQRLLDRRRVPAARDGARRARDVERVGAGAWKKETRGRKETRGQGDTARTRTPRRLLRLLVSLSPCLLVSPLLSPLSLSPCPLVPCLPLPPSASTPASTPARGAVRRRRTRGRAARCEGACAAVRDARVTQIELGQPFQPTGSHSDERRIRRPDQSESELLSRRHAHRPRRPLHPPRGGGRPPSRRAEPMVWGRGRLKVDVVLKPEDRPAYEALLAEPHDRARRPRVAPPARGYRVGMTAVLNHKRQFDQDRDQLRRDPPAPPPRRLKLPTASAGPRRSAPPPSRRSTSWRWPTCSPSHPSRPAAPRLASRVRAPAPPSPPLKVALLNELARTIDKALAARGGSSSSAPRSPSSATPSNDAMSPTAQPSSTASARPSACRRSTRTGRTKLNEEVHRETRRARRPTRSFASPRERRTVCRCRVCFSTPPVGRGVLKHTLHDWSRCAHARTDRARLRVLRVSAVKSPSPYATPSIGGRCPADELVFDTRLPSPGGRSEHSRLSIRLALRGRKNSNHPRRASPIADRVGLIRGSTWAATGVGSSSRRTWSSTGTVTG